MIVFLAVVAWSGLNLLLTPIYCEKDAMAIRKFQISVSDIRLEDDTLAILLEFRNPSQSSIEITSIVTNVKCGDYFIGSYRKDTFFAPIVLGWFSNYTEEVFLTSNAIRSYIGKKVEIQVSVQVSVKLERLKQIPLTATCTSEVALGKISSQHAEIF